MPGQPDQPDQRGAPIQAQVVHLSDAVVAMWQYARTTRETMDLMHDGAGMELAKLRDELRELRDELRELRDELRELRELRDELRDELRELRDELRELRELRDELRDELRELRELRDGSSPRM